MDRRLEKMIKTALKYQSNLNNTKKGQFFRIDLVVAGAIKKSNQNSSLRLELAELAEKLDYIDWEE